MIDPIYRLKFMQIWQDAINQEFTCNDARDLASLTLDNKPFHELIEIPNEGNMDKLP